MRIPLSAGGLEQGLPVHRPGVPQAEEASAAEKPEQYQLFDTPEYSYRVFVTNMSEGIAMLTWFYNQRAGAENLIKEAKNDAGMADHPSARWG